MLTRHIRAALLVASFAAMPAVAQDTSLFSQPATDEEAPAISPERLAAGVRQYPARVLRSLLQVAQDPLVLRQLADEPELLERPEDLSPPVSPDMHAAIKELSVMPAIVFVAADHPAELEALRALYAQSPVEMEQSILQLRVAYDQAELGAAAAWQDVLQRNPAALKEYSELVTSFCKAQRKAYADFPCVQVSSRDYYYACPPNDAIIFYALEQAESSPAMQVIEQWWQTYGPYERDARIIAGDAKPLAVQITADTVAAMPPEQRMSMWKPLDTDDSGSVGLVPMIMQPPADQTAEAYYARAVAEHARLWTPELPSEEPEELPAGELDQPTDVWLGEDQDEDTSAYGLPYVEQPVEDVYYDDGGPDYAYSSSYAPPTYSRVRYVSYHDYYAPIARYYCGYPIDWPVFYRCDPSWLVRFRIYGSYVRCGYGTRVYRSVRHGSGLSVYFGFGGWGWDRHDHSRRRSFRAVVRFGNRYYYRSARNRIARALHHRRSTYGRTTSRPLHRYGRSGTSRSSNWARYGNSTGRSVTSRSGRSLNSRSGRSLTSRAGRSLTSRSGGASASRHWGSKPRPVVPRRSGDLGRRSSPPRRSSVSSLRSPSRRPTSTVSPRRSPIVSPRPRTAPKPRTTVSPRRNSSPRRNPIVSPRTRTTPKPKSAVSRRPNSSPRRNPIVSPRPRTTPRPKSTVSPRPRTSPRPKSTASPRRRSAPRPKSTVSPRPRTSPRPKSATSPRRRSAPRPKSTVSPRQRTSPRPKSVTSPRRRSAPRPKSTVSPRPRTSPRPKSSASSRRSAPRRSPSASSRSRTSSKPKSSASSRRSAPRRSPSASSRSRSSSKPKSSASSRRSAPRRSPSASSRSRTSSKPKSSASSRRSAPRRSPGASSRSRTSPKSKGGASSRRSSSPRRSPRASPRSRPDSKPKRSGSPRRP